MHSHGHEARGRKMGLVLALNLVITLTELIGGIISGSIALLSDAAHNLSDALSAATSYFAIKISRRTPTKRYSFGYKRAETLAAFFNSNLLLVIAAVIMLESLRKLLNPSPIDIEVAAYTAATALAANTISVLLLHDHSKSSLNVKSVYLHMLGDVLASAAVLASVVIIRYTGFYLVDPATSLLISAYIAREAWHVVKEAAEILMNASPIDLDAVKEMLESIHGVSNAHHCHAWMLSEHDIALECHIEVEGNPSIEEAQEIINNASKLLREIGVTHVTLQLEKNRCTERGVVCSDVGEEVLEAKAQAAQAES